MQAASLTGNFGELIGRLGGMRKGLQDRTLPLQRCATILLRATSDRFRREVAPSGAKWEPLSEYTLRMRRKGPKADNNPKILRDTGRLFNSFSGGPDNVNKIHSNILSFGTNINYAWTHQKGRPGIGRIPAVPARPMLGITTEDQAKFLRIFGDWVRATMRGK